MGSTSINKDGVHVHTSARVRIHHDCDCAWGAVCIVRQSPLTAKCTATLPSSGQLAYLLSNLSIKREVCL